MEVEHFEVTQTTMNQVRILAAGAGSEMILFDQRDAKRILCDFGAQREIANGSGSVDPASEDHHVESFRAQAVHRFTSRRGRDGGLRVGALQVSIIGMMRLDLLRGEFAIARLGAADRVPEWARSVDFVSITRTSDELSIVCESSRVPERVRAERGWRVLKIEGPLEFSMVGVLASIAGPLAGAGISIFAISTFDTDYVLVGAEKLAAAITALQAAGHQVQVGE
jgi:hypothetical protein